MHQIKFIFEMSKITDEKLQSVSFHNHVVARQSTKKLMEGDCAAYGLGPDWFWPGSERHLPRSSYRENRCFCCTCLWSCSKGAGATPETLEPLCRCVRHKHRSLRCESRGKCLNSGFSVVLLFEPAPKVNSRNVLNSTSGRLPRDCTR